MKQIMAVYDVDPLYAARLAEVIGRKERTPFEAVAFSSLEKLREFAASHPVSLLLISEEVGLEEIGLIGAKKVVTLEGGGPEKAQSLYPGVYKYQSSDGLMREVLACYSETEECAGSFRGVSSRLIGVFSPLGRCGKTSFAITLGALLAREGRTLYLTFEPCSGLPALTGEDYRTGLSDLLYFCRQGTYNRLRLDSVIHTMGGLDYVPPARYPEDLEWDGEPAGSELLRAVSRDSGYETIVVDAGPFSGDLLQELDLCQIIYMPVEEDRLSLAKVQAFEEYLDQTGNSGLRARIRRLRLPRPSCMWETDGCGYPDRLLWGEMGDYVRQLLQGQDTGRGG